MWYVIAAIVVVGAVYWFFLRDKKPAAPMAVPQQPVQPQQPPQDQQPQM
jgi:hypothetical protein